MRYTAILVVLALALLGCGGSDSDTDPPAATTTTSTDGGSGTTTTRQPTDTTDPPNGDVNLANCPELLKWSSEWGAANQAAISGGSDPTGFEFTADYFQSYADSAPGEIRDDMQLIATAFGDFSEALAELDIDFSDPSSLAGMTAADVEKLEEVFGMIDDDAIDQASTNIAEFFDRECS